MAEADRPSRREATRSPSWRCASARPLVLAPLAIGVAYVGGWPFAVFWGVAAIGVLWEWAIAGGGCRSALRVHGRRGRRSRSAIGLGADRHHLVAAVIVLAMGALAVAALAPARGRIWVACRYPLCRRAWDCADRAAVRRALRLPGHRVLFAIVWATDIARLFRRARARRPEAHAAGQPEEDLVGRACRDRRGDPGWRSRSPGSPVSSVSFRLPSSRSCSRSLAQAGDLFESALKRRFGAKDSEPAHSRARRPDGSAGRFRGGGLAGRPGRIGCAADSIRRGAACWCGDVDEVAVPCAQRPSAPRRPSSSAR